MDVQPVTYSQSEFQPQVGRSVSIEQATQLLGVLPDSRRPPPHDPDARWVAARAAPLGGRNSRRALSVGIYRPLFCRSSGESE
jgi:hypothetical protein